MATVRVLGQRNTGLADDYDTVLGKAQEYVEEQYQQPTEIEETDQEEAEDRDKEKRSKEKGKETEKGLDDLEESMEASEGEPDLAARWEQESRIIFLDSEEEEISIHSMEEGEPDVICVEDEEEEEEKEEEKKGRRIVPRPTTQVHLTPSDDMVLVAPLICLYVLLTNQPFYYSVVLSGTSSG